MPRYKPNHLLFQLLILLICLLTCLDSRRRAGASRAFEDRKADERHFDYKSAPGEAIPEDSEESDKPKIVLGAGGGSTVEPSSTTTEVPTTTEEETTTTQSNEDCGFLTFIEKKAKRYY
ncbi:hypothetical protein B9Z55_007262 [Caenorhabditis nigoni]|uniref:Uncharacterized protein n=1 Tax=Caenorhabditis nigoni TaxID=1611254 RepID=A0A2G5V8S6_9PELO|nr:hypothetical protein B9Z55_007262 [Caenorhabditis nigoni]